LTKPDSSGDFLTKPKATESRSDDCCKATASYPLFHSIKNQWNRLL